MAFTFRFNPLAKKFDIVQDSSLLTLRGVVDTTNDLPLTGNTENDVFVVKAGDRLFTWNKVTSSGILADWVDVGSVASIDWSIITNKPTSGVGDIDDAVTKKHTQNTDTILTTDGSIALLNAGTLKTNLLSDDAINIQIDEIRARDGDGLNLFDDGGNGIFIKDGGNVGIGMSSPNAELQFPATLNNRKITLFENVNNDHQFFGFGINGGTLRYQLSATTSSHVFYAGLGSSSSQELMRIQGDGNIKIGNVAEVPLTTLHILDDSPTIRLSTGGTGNTGGFEISLGSVVDFKGLGNNDYLFSTNNVEKMRIQAGGNVGIGTSSPDALLDIEKTVAGSAVITRIHHAEGANGSSHAILQLQTETAFGGDPHIRFTVGGQGDWVMGTDNGDTDAFKISNSTVLGTTTRFTIDFEGNIGIGVSDPDAKLEVNGQIKITGGNPGNSKYLRSDANGLATWGDIGWTDLGTDVVLLDSGNNVGIGTATPNAKLDVNGDVKISDDFTVATNRLFVDVSNGTVQIGSAVTGTDAFNVFAPTTGVQTGIASFYDSSSNIKFRMRDEFTASFIPPRFESHSALGFGLLTLTDTPFIWYVNGTGNEKMRLDSNGLGIGTTASEKLDVNGNIKLSGNLTDGTDSTTPAELRTHLDNLTKHRLIDDILSTTTNLYSASFIDSLFSASANNLDIKDSVVTVADTNVTLSGEQTINGLLTSNSRVGVIGQSTASQNGIYVTSAGAWSRSTDADISAEVTNGLSFFVSNSGSTKNGNQYILITADTITLDTTGLNFIEVPRIVLGTIGGTATEGDDSRVPTQDENDALLGTNGTPSSINKYVTNSDPRLTADIAITRKESFASTNARFFGELGIPNNQGWTDSATGSATIDLVNETVFATIKQVVRHNDNFTNGSTSSFIVLTAQNWTDINAFGASYGGTSRLDTINGSSGFFSGLQANGAENPIDGNNRRYGILFDSDSGNLRVAEADAGGTTVTFDGTGGNPQINFDAFVKWECVIPAGLGSAEFYINGVLTTFSPTFIVNTGGLGTRATLSSGSTGGANRISYHDNFGVTIYEESSTKTLSVLTMSADAMQVFIPEGKRDYTIILPDGNPRPFGSEFNILTGNLLGDITLTNQDVGSPQILYNGLRTLVHSVVTTQLITSINTVDNNNVYTGF